MSVGRGLGSLNWVGNPMEIRPKGRVDRGGPEGLVESCTTHPTVLEVVVDGLRRTMTDSGDNIRQWNCIGDSTSKRTSSNWFLLRVLVDNSSPP